jgi:hypothetical protein
MEVSMADFLHGIIVALLPSMITVAWLVWRATPIDSEVGAAPLDQQLH